MRVGNKVFENDCPNETIKETQHLQKKKIWWGGLVNPPPMKRLFILRAHQKGFILLTHSERCFALPPHPQKIVYVPNSLFVLGEPTQK